MNAANPVVWFEIYVDELERAKKFYEAVLDVQLSEMPMPEMEGPEIKMIFFPANENGEGAGGALVKMEGMQAGGSSTIVYFGSEDCSVEQARIETAGGKVLQEKTPIGEYGFMVLAADTEGNTIGIHSLK